MCLISYVRSYSCVVFIILGFIDISKSTLPYGFSCLQRGSCSCVGINGELLDLAPLANSTSQPLIAATNASLYIYHPCSDVPLKALANNECQKEFGLCYFFPKDPNEKPLDFQKVISSVTLGTFEKLAINNEAVFRLNQMKQIEIVYKHTINSTTKTTYVRLDCKEDLDGYKLIIEKTSPSEHILTLTSRHACVITQHYMSGGAVFFLILVVFVALYFVGGILVLKFLRGATGVEMIPNYEFWCKLPRMAKDGFAYLKNRGKNAPDSYEKI